MQNVDIPTMMIFAAFAFFTMRLLGEIRSFRSGWAHLSDSGKLEKVLVGQLPATYHLNAPSVREPISKELKREVFERDGGKCFHCGCECFLFEWEQGKSKTHMGHHIADSIGGPEVPDNLHVSCPTCNGAMGHRLILKPAIDFAANRGETICVEGLIIEPNCVNVVEFMQKQRKAA